MMPLLFTLHLIPRPKLQECLGELPAALDPDCWESTDVARWNDHMLPDDCMAHLDEVLPRMEQHWCETVVVWGRYDEDFAEVWRQDQRVDLFEVRLDLRHSSPSSIARGSFH
jgi:hypothetical protein